MSGWELTFWISVGLVLYCYLGYGLVIATLSALFGRKPRLRPPFDGWRIPDEAWPRVTLIIAAYKEAKWIVRRLKNATLLDYPADRLEILVGCDGTEDNTAALATELGFPNVRVLVFPQRRGKASVLNDCVAAATGEILVFSDANTMMSSQSLRQLVRHFADPSVGAVCGKLELIDSLSGQNIDGLYWKYENLLKACEARVGAMLGVNGAIYAMRRALYEPLDARTIVDDFVIGMRVKQRGHQVLYEESAVAHEETPPRITDEFHRRARIGAGGFQSLHWLWPLLLPHRGMVAFAFWSHKVLRWACPLCLLLAFGANLGLLTQPLYQGLFALQLAFYGAAIAGSRGSGNRLRQRLFRIPAMFASMNLALAVGFMRYCRGISEGTWKRTERETLVNRPVLPSEARVSSKGL